VRAALALSLAGLLLRAAAVLAFPPRAALLCSRPGWRGVGGPAPTLVVPRPRGPAPAPGAPRAAPGALRLRGAGPSVSGRRAPGVAPGAVAMAMAGGPPAAFAGMADFLAASKAAAEQLLAPTPGASSDTRKLLLCLGNEAADMDSIVSALVLAVACQHGALDQAVPGLSRDYVAVPVLGIPAEDFALRQDAAYLLEQLSLRWVRQGSALNLQQIYTAIALTAQPPLAVRSGNMLIYLPSLAPEALARLAGDARLSVALTDHNKLAPGLEHLAPAVVAVVDHHEDTSVFGAAPYYQVDRHRDPCSLERALACSLPSSLIHPPLSRSHTTGGANGGECEHPGGRAARGCPWACCLS